MSGPRPNLVPPGPRNPLALLTADNFEHGAEQLLERLNHGDRVTRSSLLAYLGFACLALIRQRHALTAIGIALKGARSAAPGPVTKP